MQNEVLHSTEGKNYDRFNRPEHQILRQVKRRFYFPQAVLFDVRLILDEVSKRGAKMAPNV